jgi:hypothetical protein
MQLNVIQGVGVVGRCRPNDELESKACVSTMLPPLVRTPEPGNKDVVDSTSTSLILRMLLLVRYHDQSYYCLAH